MRTDVTFHLIFSKGPSLPEILVELFNLCPSFSSLKIYHPGNKANQPATSQVLMVVQPFACCSVTSVGKKTTHQLQATELNDKT